MLSCGQLGDRRRPARRSAGTPGPRRPARGSARASARASRSISARHASRHRRLLGSAEASSTARQRLLQRAHRELRVAVARRDRLALLGDPDAPVQRAARAGRGSRGSVRPPPRDGEPPRPWKSSSSSAVLGRLRGEPLLRVVQRPLARATKPGVLARVRVAEHHRLAVALRAQRVAVGRAARTASAIVAGAPLEVGERLEQRHEPQRASPARAARATARRARRTGARPSRSPSPARRCGRSASRASATVSSTRSSSPAAPSGRRLEPAAAARRSPRSSSALRARSSRVARSPGSSAATASLHDARADWRTSRLARWKPKTSTCHSSRRIAPRATWRGAEAVAARARGRRAAPAGRRSRARAPTRVEHVGEPVGDEAELGAQRLPLAVGAPQHARRTAAPRRRAPATPRARGRRARGGAECEKRAREARRRGRAAAAAPPCGAARACARASPPRPRDGRPCPSRPS